MRPLRVRSPSSSAVRACASKSSTDSPSSVPASSVSSLADTAFCYATLSGRGRRSTPSHEADSLAGCVDAPSARQGGPTIYLEQAADLGFAWDRPERRSNAAEDGHGCRSRGHEGRATSRPAESGDSDTASGPAEREGELHAALRSDRKRALEGEGHPRGESRLPSSSSASRAHTSESGFWNYARPSPRNRSPRHVGRRRASRSCRDERLGRDARDRRRSGRRY
jgi:hypothetical protein